MAVPDLAPEHRNKAKVAETHNSLGALAQKQRKYAESEAAYVKSLEVRQSLKPSTDREQQARARTSSHAIDPTERTHAHAPRRPVGSASVHAHPLHANLSTAMRGQEKDQALAQSYTSLGNLFSEMGELARALEQLQLAKECYVKGARSPAPPLRARRWAAWAATLEGHQTSMGSLVAARYARVPPRPGSSFLRWCRLQRITSEGGVGGRGDGDRPYEDALVSRRAGVSTQAQSAEQPVLCYTLDGTRPSR